MGTEIWERNEWHLVGDIVGMIEKNAKAKTVASIGNVSWREFVKLDESGLGRTYKARRLEDSFSVAYDYLVEFCVGFGFDRDDSCEVMPLVFDACGRYGWR